MGKLGKWLFLLLILGQNWPGVSAAAEGPQRRTEEVMGMQDAARSADERKQMNGGNPKKVEAARKV